jgi:hypothetical protein
VAERQISVEFELGYVSRLCLKNINTILFKSHFFKKHLSGAQYNKDRNPDNQPFLSFYGAAFSKILVGTYTFSFLK